MEHVKDVLVLAHFICWAIVLGFSLAGLIKRYVPKGLIHGALGALVTGLLIVGVMEMADMDVNHVKIGIKSGLALIVTVVSFMAEKKEDGQRFLPAIAGLTVITMAVAVFV